MNKIELIEKLVKCGYSLGGLTVEEFSNAFSDSMVTIIWNNFMQYKMGR